MKRLVRLNYRVWWMLDAFFDTLYQFFLDRGRYVKALDWLQSKTYRLEYRARKRVERSWRT